MDLKHQVNVKMLVGVHIALQGQEEDKGQGYSRQGSKDVRLGAAVHGDDWRHQARF